MSDSAESPNFLFYDELFFFFLIKLKSASLIFC